MGCLFLDSVESIDGVDDEEMGQVDVFAIHKGQPRLNQHECLHEDGQKALNARAV
jgi:hypothetical protein